MMEYHQEEWPHGLQCAVEDCDHVFVEGATISTQLVEVGGLCDGGYCIEHAPVVRIVCSAHGMEW